MSVVSFNPHHTQAILIFLLRLFFFHPHFGTRVRGTLPCDDLVGMKDHFDQLGVPDRVFVGPRVIRQGINRNTRNARQISHIRQQDDSRGSLRRRNNRKSLQGQRITGILEQMEGHFKIPRRGRLQRQPMRSRPA